MGRLEPFSRGRLAVPNGWKPDLRARPFPNGKSTPRNRLFGPWRQLV
jgi:hypothetical protein